MTERKGDHTLTEAVWSQLDIFILSESLPVMFTRYVYINMRAFIYIHIYIYIYIYIVVELFRRRKKMMNLYYIRESTKRFVAGSIFININQRASRRYPNHSCCVEARCEESTAHSTRWSSRIK